ncbi:MAG: aldo/keto reductase, partial [Saprospiraceae bacterium]|nr:aldo/keto reductase [Saprospiraceae bacterium]
MQYCQLGGGGPRVSRLCLGTMTFGDRTGEREAGRIVEQAKQAGINFIDTADLYNNGESERLLGCLLAAERDQWILATKVGNKIPGDSSSGGLSRNWINSALDASR